MPDVTQIRFGPGLISKIGMATVYARTKWADQWEAVPWLECTEATWSCSPAMPTAVLRWDYGRIRRYTARDFAQVRRMQLASLVYVRIVFECQWTPPTEAELIADANAPGTWTTRTWSGVVELESEQLDGVVFDERDPDAITAIETGTQTFTAYGFESLLSRKRIERTCFQKYGAEELQEVAARVAFNSGGMKNRNKTWRPSSSYLFGSDTADNRYWSTKDIVEHLLDFHTPRASDIDETVSVPFDIRAGDYLPDWDQPVVDTDSATVLSLLQRLLAPQRLIYWWLRLNEDTNHIELCTATGTQRDIHIGIAGASPVPGNVTPLHIINDDDQETAIAIRDDRTHVYDQVVLTAGDEICVGTFSVQDNTLSQGWTQATQEEYEAGASGAVNYAGLDDDEKQKANAAARAAPHLSAVFEAFKIHDTWTQNVGRGDGTILGEDQVPFFRDDVEAYPAYLPDLHIEHSLPFVPEVDYSGTRIARYEGGDLTTLGEPETPKDWMPPIVLLKAPDADADRWVRADKIGQHFAALDRFDDWDRFSVAIQIPARSRVVRVKVNGAPQHAIASGRFTPLEVDEPLGDWRYHSGMMVTLAMRSGRKVAVEYPAAPPEGREFVRRITIDTHLPYDVVTVAAGTVVDVDQDGQPVRTTGGRFGRPKDGVTKLLGIAKLAAAWYTIPHIGITLNTTRFVGEESIDLGAMITRLGDDRAPLNTHQRSPNTVVTELRIQWPVADGPTPSPPTMSLSTDTTELDPLQIVPESLNAGEKPLAQKRSDKKGSSNYDR